MKLGSFIQGSVLLDRDPIRIRAIATKGAQQSLNLYHNLAPNG